MPLRKWVRSNIKTTPPGEVAVAASKLPRAGQRPSVAPKAALKPKTRGK
jgi:hypothetical protein